MTNYLKVDFEKCVLVMDRTFYKNSAIVGSEEYAKLQVARLAYPEYTVIRRSIKKDAAKECYKGLTYDYMREYIHRFDSDAITALKELEDMLFLAECHSIRYPTIKKWFLKKYPNVAQYGLPEIESTLSVETSAA